MSGEKDPCKTFPFPPTPEFLSEQMRKVRKKHARKKRDTCCCTPKKAKQSPLEIPSVSKKEGFSVSGISHRRWKKMKANCGHFTRQKRKKKAQGTRKKKKGGGVSS
jgi:hypothetical protein